VILRPNPVEAGVDPKGMHNVPGARVFHLCDDPEQACRGGPPDAAGTDEALLENCIGRDQSPRRPDEAACRNRSAADAERLRLLAAEDNKTNQLVFRTMLKALDLDLTLVADGLRWSRPTRTAPDIVFTDISMPGMDGLEATS
jgi:hypothetical protein